MSDSLIWTLLGHLVCIAQWAAFILVDYAYLGRGRRFRHPCVWAALLALAVLALSVLCGFGFFNIKSVVSNIIYLLVIVRRHGSGPDVCLHHQRHSVPAYRKYGQLCLCTAPWHLPR